ncbi:MAG: glycosyltransferase [Caldiserica bacterium]|nr:glycosyltransferase [Caldisericota bacterium]
MSGKRKLSIGIVSSYPPRKCGVADYTFHLIESLKHSGLFSFSLYPIEDIPLSYKEKVVSRIKIGHYPSYKQAAECINREPLDLVIVQHQFLLFGKEGIYTSPFISLLQKPLICTIHTIPSSPTKLEKEALQALGRKAEKIVFMVNYASEILSVVYGIPGVKLRVIHHPYPSLKKYPAAEAKRRLGMSNHFIIATFGLLRREKGIENVLQALKFIKEKNILYLVLGTTHPEHLKKEVDTYLNELKQLVKKLGLNDKVKFIHHYLDYKELSLYLSAMDVYIAPYQAHQQVSSGSITYALGMGKAVISTPSPFAREMLSKGRGILVGFHSPHQISRILEELMGNKEKILEIEKRVENFIPHLSWKKAGNDYLKIIQECTS